MSSSSPTKAIFLTHLGMGDHITTNGLVRYLADKYDTVVVLAKKSNGTNVRFMFHDNPKIQVDEVADDQGAYRRIAEWALQREPSITIIKSGFCHVSKPGGWKSASFFEQFYESVGVDYEVRFKWEFFPRKKEEELKAPEGSFGFLHDDPSRNYLFPNKTYETLKDHSNIWILPRAPHPHDQKISGVELRYLPRGHLFAYRELLEKASTLILMDSSFFCAALVSELPMEQKKFLWVRGGRMGDYLKLSPKVVSDRWQEITA